MKTALTELIERLRSKRDSLTHSDMDTCERQALGYAVSLATELLEKEREQIIKARDNGRKSMMVTSRCHYDSSEQYFNETYKK